ncbi:unnamed protein product [Thelazia callipaeda]|uniref:OAR domain-containing protein n=1 Tax=Thelazia callipaeda TaxID=103827 RepID=A0A0N5CR23_THECL|nr:unnamed protein product [Thelazia callipaeda]
MHQMNACPSIPAPDYSLGTASGEILFRNWNSAESAPATSLMSLKSLSDMSGCDNVGSIRNSPFTVNHSAIRPQSAQTAIQSSCSSYSQMQRNGKLEKSSSFFNHQNIKKCTVIFVLFQIS